MKIRWTRNSVRLRITPDEMAQLQRHEIVAERFRLPATSGWSVHISPSQSTALSMQDGILLFCLATNDIAQLSETQREGVYFSQDDIRFYIEKDFPCAHPRAAEANEIPTATFAPPANFEERKNS